MFLLSIIAVVVLMSGVPSEGGASAAGGGSGRQPPRKQGFIDKFLRKGKKQAPSQDVQRRKEKYVDRTKDVDYQSPTGKNVRGATRGISTYEALEAYRKLKGDMNVLIPLTLDSLTNTLYDDVMNTKFAGFCGKAVRRFCSLSAHHWGSVPALEKTSMHNFLRSAYDVTDDIRIYVDQTLALQWRRYRGDLKQIYMKKIKNGESRAQIAQSNPAKSEHADAWTNMIAYWALQSTQDYSKKMSENRAKQVIQYRGGAHSMSQYVHEMNSQPPEEGGESVALNAIETFYGVHCRNGVWQNEHDQAAYEKMIEQQAAALAEQGDDEELDDDVVNMIVREVLKSGPKWDTGFGRAPTQRERVLSQSSSTLRDDTQAIIAAEVKRQTDIRCQEMEDSHRREMDRMYEFMRSTFPGIQLPGPYGGASGSAPPDNTPPFLGDP